MEKLSTGSTSNADSSREQGRLAISAALYDVSSSFLEAAFSET